MQGGQGLRRLGGIRFEQFRFGDDRLIGRGWISGQLSQERLLCETLLIGLLSLVIGLLLGIAMSQLMSIIVARMFEADMSAYVFSVSPFALQLTIFCFGFMYFMVILFHMFTIRSSSLNAMLRSQDKSETTRPKNLWLCLIVFLIGAFMLGYAYYRVSVDVAGLEVVTLMRMIVYGIIATFLLFWSLSGFVLRIAMWRRSFYYRGLNSFTLREFYTRINTTVSAMSIICILLFFTICIFASAMSLNSTFRDDLERRVPRDVQVISRESGEEVSALLSGAGFDLSGLRAVDEGPTYEAQELTLSDTLGGRLEETMSQWYAMINFDATETIMEQSDYNRVAKIYGDEQISLAADEYAVSCSMDIWKEIRTEALAMQTQIEVNGRKLKPAVQQCLDGQLEMNGMVINLGMLKAGNTQYVLDEIRLLKKTVGDLVLKVIIETCLLTEEEKIKMCDIVPEAGADFIKTSTGFSTGGATFHDIALFAEHVRGRCKIKAAGGISTVEDIEKFLEPWR